MSIEDKLVNCARLCSLVYSEEKEIFEKYNNPPDDYYFLKEIVSKPFFQSTERDCQYLISEFEDVLIISFRGTSSFDDILTDLDARMEPMFLTNTHSKYFPYVHKGFLEDFHSSRVIIDLKISHFGMKNKKNIIFTGHSLGGATATLASLFFAIKFPQLDISCVSFGSPRAGDLKFKEMFKNNVKNSYRFINNTDVVPCVPSSYRFSHVDGCKWINQHKIYEKLSVRNTVRNFFLGFFGYKNSPLDDHSCEEYIKEIECLYFFF